eukprot:m.1097984 g.1097984  ORF g.1097984 m.1097984 type:complete len:1156 (-) comp24311_c0_seq31:2505-5972(-)
MASNNVTVAVRVRPFDAREVARGEKCIVQMEGNTIQLNPKTDGGAPRHFTFDNCFWSHSQEDSTFASQENIFDDVGRNVLDNAFNGYNACIFAYGQTGSGKTYTMMGTPQDLGIIPRLCQELFEAAKLRASGSTFQYRVEVSYMEIYNERVRDLLSTSDKYALKVREHQVMGPYVEGLRRLAVADYASIKGLMDAGNQRRTTATTAMNQTSSRSHAVFTLHLTTLHTDQAHSEKASRISLVDLAGSERQAKTQATGSRLKEGASINSSLSALGQVFKALVDREKSAKGKDFFVPYRSSALTWLLKDSLGGNSKTIMVAAISPAADNHDETLSTLRYANYAKQIVNHATINHDPQHAVIQQLRKEVEQLRRQTKSTSDTDADREEINRARNELQQVEGLIATMSQSWQDRLAEANTILAQHQQLLQDHGAKVTGHARGVLRLESRLPHLVRLSGDGAGIELYTIRRGILNVGTVPGAEPHNTIVLPAGDGMDTEMCLLEHTLGPPPAVDGDRADASTSDGSNAPAPDEEVVTLHPIVGCSVNGVECDDTKRLAHGDVVTFGQALQYRFVHPDAMQRQQRLQATTQHSPSADSVTEQMERERAAAAEKKQALEAERRQLAMQQQQAEEKARAERERVAAAHAHHAAERQRLAERERENDALRQKLSHLKAELVKAQSPRTARRQLPQPGGTQKSTMNPPRKTAADDDTQEFSRVWAAEQERIARDTAAFAARQQNDDAAAQVRAAAIDAERRRLEQLQLDLEHAQREAAAALERASRIRSASPEDEGPDLSFTCVDLGPARIPEGKTSPEGFSQQAPPAESDPLASTVAATQDTNAPESVNATWQSAPQVQDARTDSPASVSKTNVGARDQALAAPPPQPRPSVPCGTQLPGDALDPGTACDAVDGRARQPAQGTLARGTASRQSMTARLAELKHAKSIRARDTGIRDDPPPSVSAVGTRPTAAPTGVPCTAHADVVASSVLSLEAMDAEFDAQWSQELARLQLEEQLTNDEIFARKLQLQEDMYAKMQRMRQEQQAAADARMASMLAGDEEVARQRDALRRAQQDENDARIARQLMQVEERQARTQRTSAVQSDAALARTIAAQEAASGVRARSHPPEHPGGVLDAAGSSAAATHDPYSTDTVPPYSPHAAPYTFV